mmetsp:Transcript_12929/g.18305  ORF Transcript_12929/g.18305 Transcript_12929/m.18305 type:complete len:133 (-) Transcript_12929:55-453(-)
MLRGVHRPYESVFNVTDENVLRLTDQDTLDADPAVLIFAESASPKEEIGVMEPEIEEMSDFSTGDAPSVLCLVDRAMMREQENPAISNRAGEHDYFGWLFGIFAVVGCRFFVLSDTENTFRSARSKNAGTFL